MKVRAATAADVENILALCREYFAGSIYAGATMNVDAWRHIANVAISHWGNAWIFLAEEGDEIAGMIYGVVTHDMVVEGVAEVPMFFVREGYRNGRAAVLLRDAFEREIAKHPKCGYSLIACSPGMGAINDRAYRMLWSGCGYTLLGSEMFRRRM